MSAPHTVYTISPSPDSTLAVETRKAGLKKEKHLFIFERFSGTLVYDPERPLDTTLNLLIDARSVLCRDRSQKPKRAATLTRFAADQALATSRYPEIQLASKRFVAKPLRGFVAEASLHLHGVEHPIKANIGFGVRKNDRIQIDADAALCLSQFGIPRPSSLFGLIHTEDEIVLHALIWGVASHNNQG
ncbi:MAG TPA: YceI family protein [Bryobacteraceae bacterium]|nr:YceI family protein [Bryobacteraceae bacterium]